MLTGFNMTHHFKGMFAGEALMGKGSKAALIGNTQPLAVLEPSLPAKSAIPVLNKVTLKGALQAECMAITVPSFRHFGSTLDLYMVHMNLNLQCEKKLLKSYLYP
jgi:hypothetical protein